MLASEDSLSNKVTLRYSRGSVPTRGTYQTAYRPLSPHLRGQDDSIWLFSGALDCKGEMPGNHKTTEQHRQIAASDMEKHGVYNASEFANPRPFFFGTTNMVDVRDQRKSDTHQVYGSLVSARFVVRTIATVFAPCRAPNRHRKCPFISTCDRRLSVRYRPLKRY